MLAPLTVERLFADAECAEIIRLAELRIFDDAGLVRGDRNDNIRRARIAWFDADGDGAWIFGKVVDAVIDANRRHFAFDLSEFAEKVQIAWYDADHGGHFDWHIDIGDGQFASKRKLTLVAQLSGEDSYRGGDLELNAAGTPEAASRARGTAILFPSFTPHRVTRVEHGGRYSLTTWVHGPAFR